VVRKKIDARTDPQRAGEIAFQLDQPAKLSLAGRINPQVARGAAPITLPARWIERVATNDATAIRPERNRLGGSRRQQFRRATIQTDGPQTRRTAERLLRVAIENDFAGIGPADDQRVCAQIRESARFAAFGRHHVHFQAAFIASAERQPCAITRERGMAHRPQARGEPSGGSAIGGNRPEIVVADEHDRFVMNRRKSVVALRFHEIACDVIRSRFSLWKYKLFNAPSPIRATVRRSWQCRAEN
jgi:hypothetical protein